MKGKMGIFKSSATMFCFICLPGQAFSQTIEGAAAPQAENADQSGIQDIVVTAQKRQESANSVPLSISVATSDTLANAGVTSTEDLGKIVPGFSYTESAYSTPVFTLRGIGFYETSLGAKPTVSVYTDEVPLPFSIMTRGATLDLERVEVLKGPQGTLFGSNATGGAINYIAAKPTDYFKAGGEVGFGSYFAFDANAFISGPITDTLKGRIAVKTQQGGGYQRSYTRDEQLGDKNFFSGRALLDFSPSDRVRFQFNANGFIDKSDGTAAQLLEVAIQGNPAFGGAADAMEAYPRAPHNNRDADWTPGRAPKRDNWFYQFALRGDIDLSDALTLTSLTSYSRYEHDTLIDPDGMALRDYVYNTLGTIKAFNQELRLSADLGDLRAMVGGNYAHETVYQEDDAGPYPDTPSAYVFSGLGVGVPFFVYDQFSDQKFINKAVFANLDYTIGNIVLHAGARYTDTSDRYRGCTRDVGNAIGVGIGGLLNVIRTGAGLPALPPIPQGGCVTIDGTTLTTGLVQQTLAEDNVSWRAGIDWKPRPGVLVYASASRGYKAGSFPLLSASDARQLDPVSQESVTAYEVGFKASVLDRRAQINGALFRYDYKDKQLKGVTIANPDIFGPLEALVNVPKSRINGAELQLDLAPIQGLRTSLAATYIDSKIKGDFVNYDPAGNVRNFSGEPFPYTPKWQLTGDIGYEFALTDHLNANIGTNISYRNGTNAALGRVPLYDIDGYALVDLRAGLSSNDDRWRAAVFVRNLTDKYYWNNTAKILDTIVRYAGQPRVFGVTLSYNFGS